MIELLRSTDLSFKKKVPSDICLMESVVLVLFYSHQLANSFNGGEAAYF